jgi:hypothetical protein
MLAFDDYVTVKIQTVGQERALGLCATVRHEQYRRRWSNGHPDDVRLVVCSFCREYACRKKDMGNDVVTGESISAAKSSGLTPFLKQALQSSMNTRADSAPDYR